MKKIIRRLRLNAAIIKQAPRGLSKRGEPYLNREKAIRKMVEAGELKLIGSVSKIWLGIPLKFGNDVIGVIAVQSYSDPDVYSEKDIPLLQVVADTIATVIERKKIRGGAQGEQGTARKRIRIAERGTLRADY